MVSPIHNKSHIGSDHAELSNHEFVARKVEKVFDILFKIFDRLKVVIVGVITYDDVRILDDVLKETKSVIMW